MPTSRHVDPAVDFTGSLDDHVAKQRHLTIAIYRLIVSGPAVYLVPIDLYTKPFSEAKNDLVNKKSTIRKLLKGHKKDATYVVKKFVTNDDGTVKSSQSVVLRYV